MKLLNFRVTNYKCITDTGLITINDTSCFLGKNDVGLSVIFEALHKFNPTYPSPDLKYEIQDYPNELLSNIDYKLKIIELEFELEENETSRIDAKFGKNSLKSNKIKISKDYTNTLTWDFQPDETVYAKHLINKKQLIDEHASKLLQTASLEECLETARKIENPSNELISFINQLEILQLRPMRDEIIEGYLQNMLPQFFNISHNVNLTNYFSLKQVNKTIYDTGGKNKSIDSALAFLKLIGADIDEIIFGNGPEVQSTLDQKAQDLTDKIHSVLPQYKNLKMEFHAQPIVEFSSQVDSLFNIQVYDETIKSTLPIEKKSRAFLHFISFICTLAMAQDRPTKQIILIDNPAIHLHATNQEQIMKYIYNEVSNQCQVLYTTHSPFLINTKKLDSLYIVRNLPEKNTVVTQDLKAEADDGTLLPLKAALLLKR